MNIFQSTKGVTNIKIFNSISMPLEYACTKQLQFLEFWGLDSSHY